MFAVTVGALAISVWIYALANDPTVRTWRRRIRLDSQLKPAQEDDFPEDLMAVLPPNPKRLRRSTHRRR